LNAAITIILKGCEVTSGGNVEIFTSRMKATTHDHRPQIGFQKHGEIHHCIASLLMSISGALKKQRHYNQRIDKELILQMKNSCSALHVCVGSAVTLLFGY
jgi:hypothetical protein